MTAAELRELAQECFDATTEGPCEDDREDLLNAVDILWNAAAILEGAE